MTAVTAREDLGYTTGDPAADGRMFRGALGRFGTGVAVVTANSGGSLVGMTINSFASVSLDPPLVLWSVRRASRRAAAFLGAESFAVNILSEEQVDVAGTFASDNLSPDIFDTVRWTPGQGGSPLLDGALARFECRPHAVHPEGDHQVILGAVERCSVREGEPLLFVQGAFGAWQSLDPQKDDDGAPAGDGAGPGSFPHLLTAASHRLSQRFDDYRARIGVSVAEGRILERLSRRPMTAEELGASAYLGARAAEDTLAQLTSAGLVTPSGPRFELTARGDQLRQQLAEATREFSQDVLSALPDCDVRAARRVLAALADS